MDNPHIARALIASAAASGCAINIAGMRERHWQTATFAGAVIDVTVAASRTPELAVWLSGLPKADLPVPGHLLADIAGSMRGDAIEVHMLTVTDK